jgi:threonine/homoserine/homoserine lactone efflux protein
MTLPVDLARYLVYLGVMAAMAAFPGPSNLTCVAMGLQRGRRAVVAATAGMNGATLLWYTAAALGLGALATALPQIFRWIALVSAAYLLWLAWGAVRSALHAGEQARLGAVALRPGRSALVDGFLVQVANPKIVLFFGAVLPPFIDAERPLMPQLVLFAVATLSFDAAAMIAYGVFGAALSSRMQQPGFRRAFNLTTAGLLALAAALVVFA